MTRGSRLARHAVAALMLSAAARGQTELPAGQVSLDEVWCAVCHWEQGDEFALSVHYREGLLLCDACHGGNPREADPIKAKAAQTGYTGKPAREAITRVCAECHSGPVAHFARGPHRDAANPNNPTCITCHHNHGVLDATLALMDSTCQACHTAEPEALAVGRRVQDRLRAAEGRMGSLAARFDSLRGRDPSLERSAPLVAAAAAALRGAAAPTHALDLGVVGESIGGFDAEVEAARQALDGYERGQRRRHLAVALVWVFAAANVGLLWLKRRQL